MMRCALAIRSFVFEDEEASHAAYRELESGQARNLLRPFAQWNLYIAVRSRSQVGTPRSKFNLTPARIISIEWQQVRPVARVAFNLVEPIEQLVRDETRRIYVDEAFKPSPSPPFPPTAVPPPSSIHFPDLSRENIRPCDDLRRASLPSLKARNARSSDEGLQRSRARSAADTASVTRFTVSLRFERSLTCQDCRDAGLHCRHFVFSTSCSLRYLWASLLSTPVVIPLENTLESTYSASIRSTPPSVRFLLLSKNFEL